MSRLWDIPLQKCRDLANRVMGPSRSLELSPFDRAHIYFPTPCVFNAPDEGVPLGIRYRRKGAQKPKWWGYQMVEKVL